MKKPYSGKFVLRVPSELHKTLSQKASRLGVSLNQLCLRLLQEQIGSSPQTKWLDLLKRHFSGSLIAAYQFGSSVRKEDTSASDIDILVILADDCAITRDLYRQWDELAAQENLNSKLALHFVHLPATDATPGSLWLEVALEGVPLWDPEYAVHNTLIRIRKDLLNSVYTRQSVHGHPVWILNKEEDNHAKPIID